MFDLIDVIFNHFLGQLDFSVQKEAFVDKVGVPIVHLVEPASRNHVSIRKIQQSMLFWEELTILCTPTNLFGLFNGFNFNQGHFFGR